MKERKKSSSQFVKLKRVTKLMNYFNDTILHPLYLYGKQYFQDTNHNTNYKKRFNNE